MDLRIQDTSSVHGRFRIRPVVAADNADLAAVIRSVISEVGVTGPGSSIRDPEVDDMAAAYTGPRTAYYVVTGDDGVVGGGGVGPLAGGPPDTCELRKMYLRPDARGHGLGRALLERCLAAAAAFGYARMYLETLQAMQDARRLYERNGFRAVGTPLGHTGHFGCDAWFVRDL